MVSAFDDQSLPLTFNLVSDVLHGTLGTSIPTATTRSRPTRATLAPTVSFSRPPTARTATRPRPTSTSSTPHPVAEGTSEAASHDDVFNSWASGYDDDLDAVSFALAAATSNGAVSLASDGSYTYTPNPGYVGPDSFDFSVSDGFDSTTATVSIDVFNDSTPVADDAGEALLHDRPFTSAVTGSDADNDPLVFSLAVDGAHGHAVINADGSYTYTPNAGYFGDDVIYFTVTDGAASDTGSVTLDIYDTAPTGYDDNDYWAIDEAQLVVTALNGVLANDDDYDGNALTALLVSGPEHAAEFNFNSDGSFDYDAVDGYDGYDSFVYQPFNGAFAGPCTRWTIAVGRVSVQFADGQGSGWNDVSGVNTDVWVGEQINLHAAVIGPIPARITLTSLEHSRQRDRGLYGHRY